MMYYLIIVVTSLPRKIAVQTEYSKHVRARAGWKVCSEIFLFHCKLTDFQNCIVVEVTIYDQGSFFSSTRISDKNLYHLGHPKIFTSWLHHVGKNLYHRFVGEELKVYQHSKYIYGQIPAQFSYSSDFKL